MPGDSSGIRKRLEAKKARPADVPLQRVPDESWKRQFTSGEGKPSTVVYVLHWPFAKELSPLGVANHIAPSRVSRMDETVFEPRPLVVVYVVKCPSLNLLTPPFSVPAHTKPSRLS